MGYPARRVLSYILIGAVARQADGEVM
jgi:hypothetical protein